MTSENRRFTRFPVELAAEISLGPRTLSAATQNLSEGGVGLVVDEPLVDGAEVRLSLFLTQDGIEDPDQEPLETGAVVAWSAPSDQGVHLIGLRFGALSPSQQGQLQRFLAAIAE